MTTRPELIAERIETARRDAGLIEPFSDSMPHLTLADAYAIADLASRSRRDSTGARTVGRKIGFTNRTIWERYGVFAPIWGWMYDDTVGTATSAGATGADIISVDLTALVQPRIEPEIVIGLARPVNAGDGPQEIAESVEWVAAGFEVVHCHYPGWRFRIVDTIIDASLHGASRIGTRHDPWPGMVDDLTRFSVALHRNDSVIDRGVGGNVLGGPLHAIAHLAAVVGRLEAGEVLTTGTVTDAAPVQPGETYTMEIEGLPVEGVRLRFA
jgi:2-oxo-3-hexenedioate decarboxylase